MKKADDSNGMLLFNEHCSTSIGITTTTRKERKRSVTYHEKHIWVRNPNNYKKKKKKKVKEEKVTYKDVTITTHTIYPTSLYSEKAIEFSMKLSPAATNVSISLQDVEFE